MGVSWVSFIPLFGGRTVTLWFGWVVLLLWVTLKYRSLCLTAWKDALSGEIVINCELLYYWILG